jgi:pilus assembly protein CpaE
MLARLAALTGKPTDGNDTPAAGTGALKVSMLLRAETLAGIDPSRLAVPGVDVRLVEGGLRAFAANAPLQRRTDIAIVEVDPDDPGAVEALEQFATTSLGRMPVVAAVHNITVATTRRMLRSDIADVLGIPFTAEDLAQAIETGRERIDSARTGQGPSRHGHVVAVHGAIGGAGATSLATQAAQIWSETRSVCLIDLDVQNGNAALYLNLKPRLSLADLAEAGDRLDAEFLRMVMERHKTGLSVIGAPADMQPLDMITSEFVDRLLDLASQMFDVVVVDLPGIWLDWSATAMQKADLIALVTVMSVPGIHQARRQLDVIEANSLGDRVRVILNRMTVGLFGKIDVSEAEGAMRHRVHFAVTNDYPGMSAAVDEGKLISQIKVKSRVEKDIRLITSALSDEMAAMGTMA